MRFGCPLCNHVVNVQDDAAGTKVVCPGCSKNIVVPNGRFDTGCIIGDFIINSYLGKGALGTVYKATQISLDRTVALKVLNSQSMTEKGIADFLKEARAAATLTHINLVQSYAVGMDEGYIYMAMTYINGETLRSRLLREKTIPIDESLHIIQQVAEALYYAWEDSHIIHRDVKPENIMLTEHSIVKLTDLGLAMCQSEWSENMEISGSPFYMSPEQFSGGKLDTRSDIYSLGITLYQMLTGVLPYPGDTVTTIAKKHFETDPVPVEKLCPDLPDRVIKLIRKMMEKDINDRFANMEELLQEIWAIRQTTAPSRHMVPDVHTISMRRLDYEVQNEEAARQAAAAGNSKPRVSVLVKKTNTDRSGGGMEYAKYFLWAVPVILILLVSIFFMFDSKETENAKRVRQKIDEFEQLADDPAYRIEDLKRDMENLIEQDIEPLEKKDPFFFYAADHLRFLLLQRIVTENRIPSNNSHLE